MRTGRVLHLVREAEHLHRLAQLRKLLHDVTIAIAKSREACSIVKPSVVVSTTSPVVMRPARHSRTAQISTPAVTQKTLTAWNSRNRSSDRRLAPLRLHLVLDLVREPCLSRAAAPKMRTSPMLLTTSVRSPLTLAAWPAKCRCRWWLPRAAIRPIVVAQHATMANSTAVSSQLIGPARRR